MWESLPSIVLYLIYEHVDLKTKLSASKTCKNWREALFNPRCRIHDKLHMRFLCKPSKHRVSGLQLDIPKCFIKHAKLLVIDWCACHEENLATVLSSMTNLNHVIEHIHFIPKGEFFGCTKRTSQSTNGSITDIIINFISLCKKIKILNFGLNLSFSQNINVLNAVELKSRKLEGLDISYFTSREIECEDKDKILPSWIKGNKNMMSLKELYLDWDENFEDLLASLRTGESSIKTLGLLAQDSISFNQNISDLPVAELWRQLKSQIPDLKVKLTLSEIRKGHIRTVLNKEMPLISLCVVYRSNDFIEIVIDNLKNTEREFTLEEIGFHYVEGLHFKLFVSREGRNSNCSNLITDFEWLKCLKRFSWSGQFILDTDILKFVTQHASTLKKLSVHKQEVVSESKATAEYFIPLAAAKIHGLERAVCTTWGRPWKMIDDPPIQRLPRRGIRYDYMLQEEMFWVLQTKAFCRDTY